MISAIFRLLYFQLCVDSYFFMSLQYLRRFYLVYKKILPADIAGFLVKKIFL